MKTAKYYGYKLNKQERKANYLLVRHGSDMGIKPKMWKGICCSHYLSRPKKKKKKVAGGGRADSRRMFLGI